MPLTAAGADHGVMHLTLAQSFAGISTAAAGWLMVRAGTAKGALQVKVADRCAACGRRRRRGLCACAGGD
jgi:hypothetical protein